jgi:hypothetical protein
MLIGQGIGPAPAPGTVARFVMAAVNAALPHWLLNGNAQYT